MVCSYFPTQKQGDYLYIPSEILTTIYWHSDHQSAALFSIVCKALREVYETEAVQEHFVVRYNCVRHITMSALEQHQRLFLSQAALRPLCRSYDDPFS